MKVVKYLFGWIGVIVNAVCLLIAGFTLLFLYQYTGADAFILVAMYLLPIMLVATVTSVLCFKSVHSAAKAM